MVDTKRRDEPVRGTEEEGNRMNRSMREQEEKTDETQRREAETKDEVEHAL